MKKQNPVYVIEYVSRRGRTRKAYYATLEKARDTAKEIFKWTGIVVAITEQKP